MGLINTYIQRRRHRKRMAALAPEMVGVLEDVRRLWDHHCDVHGDGKPSLLHRRVIRVVEQAHTWK